MGRLRIRLCIVVILLITMVPSVVGAAKPVVYAVLFFSPYCSHCHIVIDQHLPLWQQEFGDQFQLVMVDVSTQQGQILFNAAAETPSIKITGFGVPTMIIGTTVLSGSIDIPQLAPGLIREGLSKGGIALPPIAGLREVSSQNTPPQLNSQPAWSNSVANLLALGVLVGLVVSTGLIFAGNLLPKFRTMTRRAAWLNRRTMWAFALVSSLAATGLASTLLITATGETVLLTGGVTLVLLFETICLALGRKEISRPRPLLNWLLPVAVVAGIAVAVYLTSIELTQSEAFCGLVGDCNTVQQSPYARLFGVLPIGLLGIAGYASILVVWLVGRVRLTAFAQNVLEGLVLFGVVFSIYLTFLELFVIGATCIWCLTSAVIMLLLLWLTSLETTSPPIHRAASLKPVSNRS